MFKRFLVGLTYCLLPVTCYLPSSEARDFVRGPLIVSLSDKWTVTEEPGPELIKAALAAAPTSTLAIWKYKSGLMAPEQFLSDLRSDLGWTTISSQTTMDPRFGRTAVGLYKKVGAYEEFPFKIRSYDFVLNGDIYVLEMRAPVSGFESSDTEFRAVFANLSNMSGLPGREGERERGREVEPPDQQMSRPGSSVSAAAVPVGSVPSQSGSPVRSVPAQTIPTGADYTFLYQLSDGTRIGFDVPGGMATVQDASGNVTTAFPVTGKPLVTSTDLFLLSGEYAYRVDPKTGNVVARLPIHEVMSIRPSPPAAVHPPLSSAPPAPYPSPTGPSEGDPVKSALLQADGIRKTKGLRPAIDYLTAQRPAAEKSRSPHLYEFYFRMGEYWEETGDLETALAYYRLATKSID